MGKTWDDSASLGAAVTLAAWQLGLEASRIQSGESENVGNVVSGIVEQGSCSATFHLQETMLIALQPSAHSRNTIDEEGHLLGVEQKAFYLPNKHWLWRLQRRCIYQPPCKW